MNIVWFKRDLRIYDHEPLNNAIKSGPTLALYILEHELWQQPDMSRRHYRFLQDCLNDLEQDLKTINLKLTIRVGDAIEVFKNLSSEFNIRAIYSHQETWNMWTYDRDIRVNRYLRAQNILWNEYQNNGIFRRLKSRDGWASKWHQYMSSDQVRVPNSRLGITALSERLPTASQLKLDGSVSEDMQTGGRTNALKTMNSFFEGRGQKYSKEMSSPVSAYNSCSRISPYIAFGCISIREIYQDAQKFKTKVFERGNQKDPWRMSIRSFLSRLRWHCHFIQKLEDQPNIENENLHSAMDGIREPEFNEKFFNAWRVGRTGYPFVDACMRALGATGWINFRMRAMLVSFASNHLWLHWQKPALHLANMFIDYEPGIHYPQIQMQSGTTGINAIRIYNPIKQGLDQDPTGVFIRTWVPEISHLPLSVLHTPWDSKEPPTSYPKTIVDEVAARKSANQRLYALRGSEEFRAKASAIAKKHASRKPNPKITRRSKEIDAKKQIELF